MHLLGEETPYGGEVEISAHFPALKGLEQPPYFIATIKDWRVNSPWLAGVFSGTATLRKDEGRLIIERFALSCPEATVTFEDVPLEKMALSISGRAEKDISSQSWRLPSLSLELGQGGKALSLQGSASWSPGKGVAGLEASLAGAMAKAKDFQDILSPLLPTWLLDAGATGSCNVTCEITPSTEDAQGLSIRAVLQPRKVTLWSRQGAGSLSGLAQFQAHMDQDGMFESWSLESNLTLPGGKAFKGARLALALQSIEGDADSAAIRKCVVRPFAAADGSPLEFNGRIRSLEEAVSLEGLALQLGQAGRLSGLLVLSKEALSGSLFGKGLDLGQADAFIRQLWALPFPSYAPQGVIDTTISLSGSPDSPAIVADLKLGGVGFASPDGDLLAENVGLSLHSEITVAKQTQMHFTVSGSKGGMLYKTVFLDLGVNPLYFQTKATLDPTDTLRLSGFRLQLEKMGLVMANGSVTLGTPIAYNIDATASRLELENIFTNFVREPLAAAAPALSDAVASGGAALEIQAKGAGTSATLAGELDLVQAGFAMGDNETAIKGLQLHLPFSYDLTVRKRAEKNATTRGRISDKMDVSWGAGSAKDLASGPRHGVQTGTLSVSRITTPLGKIESLNMPVWLADNQLGLAGAVRLPLYGGALAISNIRIDNPLAEDFSMRCKAVLESIDFAQIHAGPVPLQGTLQGDLGQITLDKKRLTTQKALNGSFFGGELTVKNVGALRPLNASRTMMADASVKGLDLERLSKALDLGEVTGRLDVNLQDLEMAYGQPVGFQLQARSIPTDGVDQDISLKAVNAISVMGTGQGLTGMGVSMFASFFKSFAYEAIGLACDLNNDIFKVRGLIKEGGVEYLIKKPPLFGINVINGNPDNSISFSDMQKRLERVLSPSGAKISLFEKATFAKTPAFLTMLKDKEIVQ